jgi:hypothetical protein
VSLINNIIYLVHPTMLAMINLYIHSVKRFVDRSISGYITTASLAEF